MSTQVIMSPTQDKQIPEQVLAILRCPQCGCKLGESVAGLSCGNCSREFPHVNGVIRLVDSSLYAGSFGFQWKRYATTQLDSETSRESGLAFTRRTGFTPQEFSGKLILDVGCGMGRFAEVASRAGGIVVGIDLSIAAEVAARNLAQRRNVTIFQADVFALPFAPGSFDYIYSIGVLHHTPSCEQAFKMLPPLLKPGGKIGIWLYSGYNKWYRMSDFYRIFTTRMPKRLLHALCYAAGPLYYLHRGLEFIPFLGRYASGMLRYLLPTNPNPNFEWRVLDTFDWYSPKYQSKLTYEEVFRWFESCGLDHLRVLYDPIAVQGTRPSEPSSAAPEALTAAGKSNYGDSF